jgi:PhnB protein
MAKKAKAKAATKRKAKAKTKPKRTATRPKAKKVAKKAVKKVARKAAKKKVQAIPAGYNHVTAYLIARDGAKAIDFYTRVFGAKERLRMPGPDGKIGHAEFKIGDSLIMLSDESPNWGTRSPLTLGGSAVHIMLYVKDVDATVAKAVAAGAMLTRAVETQFYGDRSGSIQDHDGHVWHVSTHVEDVSPKELRRRAAERAKAAEAPKPAEAPKQAELALS